MGHNVEHRNELVEFVLREGISVSMVRTRERERMPDVVQLGEMCAAKKADHVQNEHDGLDLFLFRGERQHDEYAVPRRMDAADVYGDQPRQARYDTMPQRRRVPGAPGQTLEACPQTRTGPIH